MKNIIYTLCTVFIFISCSSSEENGLKTEDSITGAWLFYKTSSLNLGDTFPGSFRDLDPLASDFSYSFNQDLTFDTNFSSSCPSGVYAIDGNIITMTYDSNCSDRPFGNSGIGVFKFEYSFLNGDLLLRPFNVIDPPTIIQRFRNLSIE